MATRWPPSPKQGLVLLALLLVACGDDTGQSRSCDDKVKAAGDFLDDPSNLTCASDEDCTIVFTGCHTFPRGLCGQAHLNFQAADSETWEGLNQELSDCDAPNCVQCTAALAFGCTDGYCGGAP